jgi:Butirosin biosynthesis protein H, N-terminal/Domain of unknown function (DUF4872)
MGRAVGGIVRMTALEAATDIVLVPGYEHLPGHHCGSTAIRNLLHHHGAEYSEAMAFGLGAGPCFFYFPVPEGSPSRFTNGRTRALEKFFVELTDAPIAIRRTEDRAESWAMAREAVDSGRPVILLTDLYYLDHYGKSAHFPGHAVVLVGYDSRDAYVSDTSFEELQRTSLASLAEARHSQVPPGKLRGEMFEVTDPNGLGGLERGATAAISKAVEMMLEPEFGEFQGMPAIERLANEVEGWPEELSDWQWCARFAYQTIERRGTGGGNYRRLYADFLGELGREEEAVARSAADRWTELGNAFKVASESDEADPALWTAIGRGARRAAAAEHALWSALEG